MFHLGDCNGCGGNGRIVSTYRSLYISVPL